MTQAYVYQWTELSTGKWYIGSRTKKNCHPDDGYICSSKIVLPLIKENPKNWARKIIDIGSGDQMLELEIFLLQELNAAYHDMSYNQHNGDKNFNRLGKTHTEESKQKMSSTKQGSVPWNKGKSHCSETIEKIKNSLTGKPRFDLRGIPNKYKGIPRSDDVKQKISKTKMGKPKSEKAKENMRLAWIKRKAKNKEK